MNKALAKVGQSVRSVKDDGPFPWVYGEITSVLKDGRFDVLLELSIKNITEEKCHPKDWQIVS